MNLQSMNLNALKRPTVIIPVVVVLVLAALWWFLWMSPEASKLSTVNAQQSQLESQLSTLNLTLQTDKAQAPKISEYAGYLSMFAAAVPPLPEAPQLTTELADLANATSVHLVTLSDNTTVVGTPVDTIPLTMTIQGPRQNCIAFLNGIYNPKMIARLVTITSFTPSPVSAGAAGVNVLKPSGATYSVAMSGLAYYFPEIDPSAGSVTTTTSN